MVKYSDSIQTLVFKLLIATLFIGVCFSCRKGDNDPWLSVRSRKARLTGDWELKSGEVSEFDYGSDVKSTMFYTSNSLQEIIESPSQYTVIDYELPEYTLSFEKNGTYQRNVKIVRVSVNGNSLSIPVTDIETSSGEWLFLLKNKEVDLKKREALVLNVQENINTHVNPDTTISGYVESGWEQDVDVWEIDRLANKELFVKGESLETYNGEPVRTIKFYLKFEKK